MAAPLAVAVGMRGGCVKLPQPSPLPCKREENSCKPQENSPEKPATPWPFKPVLLRRTWPRNSVTSRQPVNFPAPHSWPLAAENFSWFLMWVFFPLLQLHQGCWLGCSAAVRAWARPGAEMGLGTRKCWARVSSPRHHALLGPASPQGRGNTRLLLWNRVQKWVCSTVKLWQPWPALKASQLSARLVNQVLLNCQIHQTSKEMKLFPWDSFCSELPFEEPGSEV